MHASTEGPGVPPDQLGLPGGPGWPGLPVLPCGPLGPRSSGGPGGPLRPRSPGGPGGPCGHASGHSTPRFLLEFPFSSTASTASKKTHALSTITSNRQQL